MFRKIKQWLRSKTINYGLLLMIVGSLEINFNYLKEYIPEEWYGALFVLVGILVVILRFLTTTSLKNK